MEAASSSSRGIPPQPPKTFMAQLPCHIGVPSTSTHGYVITAADLERLRAAEKEMQEQEDLLQKQYKPVFIPVDEYLNKEINCEMINTDIKAYPWKQTPFGDAYYSPRYSDDRYTYRHVILSSSIRKEAEKLASNMPGGLLSEEVFIHYLGITMSTGWTHFMVFNKQLREIILRKPKDPEDPNVANSGERGAKRVDGEPATEDETETDSDDDEEQRLQLQRLRQQEKKNGLRGQQQQQQQKEAVTTRTAQNRELNAKATCTSVAVNAAVTNSAASVDGVAAAEAKSDAPTEIASAVPERQRRDAQPLRATLSSSCRGSNGGRSQGVESCAVESASNVDLAKRNTVSTAGATRGRKAAAVRRVSPRQAARRGGQPTQKALTGVGSKATARPSGATTRSIRATATEASSEPKSAAAEKRPTMQHRGSGRPRAAGTTAKQATVAARIGKRELAAVARNAAAAARAAAAINTASRKRTTEGNTDTKVPEPKVPRVQR